MKLNKVQNLSNRRFAKWQLPNGQVRLEKAIKIGELQSAERERERERGREKRRLVILLSSGARMNFNLKFSKLKRLELSLAESLLLITFWSWNSEPAYRSMLGVWQPYGSAIDFIEDQRKLFEISICQIEFGIAPSKGHTLPRGSVKILYSFLLERIAHYWRYENN